jgi:hypothetical protein
MLLSWDFNDSIEKDFVAIIPKEVNYSPKNVSDELKCEKGNKCCKFSFESVLLEIGHKMVE